MSMEDPIQVWGMLQYKGHDRNKAHLRLIGRDISYEASQYLKQLTHEHYVIFEEYAAVNWYEELYFDKWIIFFLPSSYITANPLITMHMTRLDI